jgi:hypothetical protein
MGRLTFWNYCNEGCEMKWKSCHVLLLLVAVFCLAGCGGGGDTTERPILKRVGWFFIDSAPDYYNNGSTCSVHLSLYYDDTVAPADIDTFTLTAQDGRQWTASTANLRFGTTSSGEPYTQGSFYYSNNPQAFPLAGVWTVRLKLKTGATSAVEVTFHEPAQTVAASHQFLYAKEDWTPVSNQSQYVAALLRFPADGYTVLYAAANGGKITTSGLSAVRASYLAAEPKAYNSYCWLYDGNNTYLGSTIYEYSSSDHSPTSLITSDGELSIVPASTRSADGTASVDLSQVKYLRFVYTDGAQFAPASYSTIDYRSISALVAVH